MNYPILEHDPTPQALIEPSALHAARDVPEAAVLCFFHEVIEKLVAEGLARECVRWSSEQGATALYELESGGDRLAILHPGVGAPIAAIRLEAAIALGCRRFVSCGGAGALVPELALGHVVVPTSAVRDEGTSYHYLPPGREVMAKQEAVRSVQGQPSPGGGLPGGGGSGAARGCRVSAGSVRQPAVWGRLTGWGPVGPS